MAFRRQGNVTGGPGLPSNDGLAAVLLGPQHGFRWRGMFFCFGLDMRICPEPIRWLSIETGV